MLEPQGFEHLVVCNRTASSGGAKYSKLLEKRARRHCRAQLSSNESAIEKEKARFGAL